MPEVIFSIDYELYGSGQGNLREHVLEPMQAIAGVFDRHDANLVVFVEALEFARIKQASSDADIGAVCRQILDLHRRGHEIALHIHPQWANAYYRDGAWHLDYNEYNLCTLPKMRITKIVDEALDFLRDETQDPTFIPRSFRAGNWLFQPTACLAEVLADRGIKIDSSVFKGGLHREPPIDYRDALGNPAYWTFRTDVNVPDPHGPLVEVPIHTVMVPFWRMITRKRFSLQRRSMASRAETKVGTVKWLDYARPRYPLKFDFCRMTFQEMKTIVEREVRRAEQGKVSSAVLVAIGHTKDLVDVTPIGEFLGWLRSCGIHITTLESFYDRRLRTAE